MPERSILLLGMGNPILTDDAIGITVAREIAKRGLPNIDVQEISASGIEVMELMLDYSKVIIVDAIVLPGKKPGEIMRLDETDFTRSVHGSSPHGVNIATAIALGKQLAPERMPREIIFFAMQAEDVETFREGVTESVKKGLPDLVSVVMKELLTS